MRACARKGWALAAILMVVIGMYAAFELSNSNEPETLMAMTQQVVPLKQTPVVRKVDLNQKTEFEVQVLKQKPTEKTMKRILIYHTHTYEAYRQNKDAPYKETEKWRTKDIEHNMVRIGRELAALLKAKGYEVVHDQTAFEPPDLSASYTRSLKMLEERTGKGETYDLYIDLHRDAYNASMANQNTVLNGGQKLARLMVLIGKGTGQSYTEKPDWEKNFAIAQALTDDLNSQVEGLCRKISLKTGRFNQHIAPRCILLEAGNNENTLEEVLASMPYLADALHRYLSGE